MKTKDRHTLILQLRQSGVADVEELCAKLTVSASTIRCDQADAGKIVRTYGDTIPIILGKEQPLDRREQIAIAASSDGRLP